MNKENLPCDVIHRAAGFFLLFCFNSGNDSENYADHFRYYK